MCSKFPHPAPARTPRSSRTMGGPGPGTSDQGQGPGTNNHRPGVRAEATSHLRGSANSPPGKGSGSGSGSVDPLVLYARGLAVGLAAPTMTQIPSVPTDKLAT